MREAHTRCLVNAAHRAGCLQGAQTATHIVSSEAVTMGKVDQQRQTQGIRRGVQVYFKKGDTAVPCQWESSLSSHLRGIPPRPRGLCIQQRLSDSHF